MSSTLLVRMASPKEVKRFGDWLLAKANGQKCNIIVPEHPDNPDMVRCRGAWVDAPDEIWGKSYISFDSAIWDQPTQDFVFCIAREMVVGGHFKVKAAGWASIGMCDTLDEFVKQRICWSERSYMSGYRKMVKKTSESTDPDMIQFRKDNWPENWKEVFNKGMIEQKNRIDAMTKRFRRHAKRFFLTDSPDLILPLTD